MRQYQPEIIIPGLQLRRAGQTVPAALYLLVGMSPQQTRILYLIHLKNIGIFTNPKLIKIIIYQLC